MRQRRWRRLMTVGVIASLLLGLAATGLGIEDLHKIDNINASAPTTSILYPIGGQTISGVATLVAKPIGPNVTAVDFLATGGAFHDTKIATGDFGASGWVSQWNTRNLSNGNYEITSVGYNATGQSSSGAAVTVKVKNF